MSDDPCALLSAQRRCVDPRGIEARRAAKAGLRRVRDTTQSQQLCCIRMAKEPPATDEGPFLLVVPYQQ
jgi:hypothetical protein